jgi:hypothetical protein
VQRSHGTAALVILAAAVLIGYSAQHLWDRLGDDAWWRRISAALALASILAAAAYIFGSRVRNKIRARRLASG